LDVRDGRLSDAANGGDGERPTICVLELPHFEQGWGLSVGFGRVVGCIADAVSTNNAPPSQSPQTSQSNGLHRNQDNAAACSCVPF